MKIFSFFEDCYFFLVVKAMMWHNFPELTLVSFLFLIGSWYLAHFLRNFFFLVCLHPSSSGLQSYVIYVSWLTNIALVYEPKCGGRGGVAGSHTMSTAVHRSPNKLCRSHSITNLCLHPLRNNTRRKLSWILFTPSSTSPVTYSLLRSGECFRL